MNEPPRTLLRVLGSAFGLAIVVGATIGGGILSAPGSIATALPSTALFMTAWVVGGINALLGATVYSELGTMMPSSGGIYVYARRAFGDGVGFFVGYADWINWSVSSAALILLVGQYLGELIAPLAGHALLAGCIVFGGLCLAQLAGVRSGGRVQEVTSVLKAVALIGLVIAVFVLPHAVPAAAMAGTAVVPHGIALVLAFGIAMQGVIFSYDSYYAVVYCGEEMQDPGRAIPRSMFQGLVIIIAIYLLINAAFLVAVPVQQVAGDTFVGATVARLIFGPRGDTIIRIIMVVAILGTVNAQIMAAPRILLAMARDGLFPKAAMRVTAGGTPAVALLMSLVVTGAALFTGSFDFILGIDVFFIVVLYVINYSSLFALRRTEPDAARPYRAWGYPYVPSLALAIAVGLLITMVIGDRHGALITAAIMAVTWPAWHIVRSAIRTR